MELAIWVVLASAVVLTLVIFTMRLLRHAMGRSMGHGRLQIIEAVPVGRGIRLVLVRIADEHLLLGVSDSRVSTITRVSADCITADVDGGFERESTGGSFVDTLRHMIGRSEGS